MYIARSSRDHCRAMNALFQHAQPTGNSGFEGGASKLPISGVVIAKNEADRIARCVSSMRQVCSEVIVLDSGSTDDTVAIATDAGARVEQQDWLGFSAQKNAAIALACNDWILLLDADEWLTDDSSETLRKLFESGRIEHADAWLVQRRTRFLGKKLRFGGWGKEAIVRLFMKRFRYLPAKVHEKLDLSDARIFNSHVRVEHDTARSLLEYQRKLKRYAELFAEQKFSLGKRAGAFAPFSHALFYVVKNGLLRGGFLDGPRGWRYHLEHTRYTWLKYQYLRALKNADSTQVSERP